MSAPVDDNGHPSLAFLRKNSAARRERMEKGLSRASSQATTTTSSSSNTSSSVRYYPSDSSNMTTASIEHYLASAPLPPPPPPGPPSSAPPGHQQILTDDHFDIIDSLNYDDIDDGMFERELDHRRRETLVQQLITSERAYYESLRVVQQVFIEPLQKDAKQSSFNFLGMKKLVCTERETRWLFGNFDEIVQVHQEILASLEERSLVWKHTRLILTTTVLRLQLMSDLPAISLSKSSLITHTKIQLSKVPPCYHYCKHQQDALAAMHN
ncbi:hypothetical protein RO3G_04760 [Lichtheimia corymbifera JMRC:FSU:9682]|uniref:DH domain-containing protein n=1 Tax=Lichtheimia corymbifera JMRC:FSU:9682 TaxID=1263082 RepID=A0A068RVS8_9FUNG|nr:hypothetical protein RO3G_04760 [Lichtheimia corymbifera JMRC:FSU:9682]